MDSLPHTKGCFVCGLHNPIGFQLGMETDSRIVEARFKFREEHAGFRGVIHGGLISTVLDEVMAWVIGVNAQRFAYCAELNVRFLKTAHPGVPVVARAELLESKRGRLFLVKAALLSEDGEAHAEANGKFLPIPESQHGALFRDFAEDPTRWLGPGAAVWNQPAVL